MQRRLAAILVADVVGYSRLMGQDEAGTVALLSQLRKDRIEPLIAEHRGRVVKLMGDGILAEFASVVDAVTCALAWQFALANEALQFRIGINLGDVIVEEDDLFGDGVNVAARLEPLAAPGGLCVSAVVHDQVHRKLGVSFVDLGKRQLKNIEAPVQVFAWTDRKGDEPAKGPSGKAESLRDRAIAVLPFENLSSDPDQDFFAEGITEDIITTLSKIPNLGVIARNATAAYRGQRVDAKEVAAALGASHVLEGRVRRGGNRMRITAQLIDARKASPLWAERYDRSVEDIFEVQDDITRNIAVSLQAELVMGDYAYLWQGGSSNFEAWQYKARGVHEYLKFTREGMLKAKEQFEKAVLLEPGDEAAMASLGHCYDQLASAGWVQDCEAGFSAAQDLGERILQANPESAQAFVLLAAVQRSRGQFDEAIENAERAVELAPNDSSNHAFLASTLISADRPAAALAPIETAVRLNPTYPNWFGATLVQAYRLNERPQAALAAVGDLVRRYPTFLAGLALKVIVLSELGMTDLARQAADELLGQDPGFSTAKHLKRVTLKNAARLEDMKAALRGAGLPE